MALDERTDRRERAVYPHRGGWLVECRVPDCWWAARRPERTPEDALARWWEAHQASERHQAAKAANEARRDLVEAVARAIERANP